MNEFVLALNEYIIEKDKNTGGYVAKKNGKIFLSHAYLDKLLELLSKINASKK